MKSLATAVFVSLSALAAVGAQDLGSVLLGVGLGIAKVKVANALTNGAILGNNGRNNGFRNNNGYRNNGFNRRNGFGGGGRRRGGGRRNNGDLVIRLGRSVEENREVELAEKYVESLERAVLADSDNCMKKLVCDIASRINFAPVSVSYTLVLSELLNMSPLFHDQIALVDFCR